MGHYKVRLILSPSSRVVGEVAALLLDSGHSERMVHRRNLLRRLEDHKSRGPNVSSVLSDPNYEVVSFFVHCFHNPPCLCISCSSYPSTVGVDNKQYTKMDVTWSCFISQDLEMQRARAGPPSPQRALAVLPPVRGQCLEFLSLSS